MRQKLRCPPGLWFGREFLISAVHGQENEKGAQTFGSSMAIRKIARNVPKAARAKLVLNGFLSMLSDTTPIYPPGAIPVRASSSQRVVSNFR